MESISKEEALRYTRNWKELFKNKNKNKLSSEISKYLNSGFSFNLNYENYKIMKCNGSESVHYYFGVSEEMKFYILIIDNMADKKCVKKGVVVNVLKKELVNFLDELSSFSFEKYLHNTIQQQEFCKTRNTMITSSVALTRSFRWKLFSENWIIDKFSGSGNRNNNLYFPLIVNPIQDLDYVFRDNKGKKAYHFFGLKRLNNLDYEGTDRMSDYTIDIIISNIIDKNNLEKGVFTDDSCPCMRKEFKNQKDNYSLIP